MVTQQVRRRKNRSANEAASISTSSTKSDETKKKEALITNTNTSSHKSASTKYDEYAWFILFVLALSYFILSRSGGGNRNGLLSKFSKPYEVVASSVTIGSASSADDLKKNEDLLRSIFYVQKGKQTDPTSLALVHKLEVVISSPPDVNITDICLDSCSNQEAEPPFLSHISSTTWVHDAELGRGYLLIADAGRSGRIWRWEVGGGPITIGRSLHMENSGCRSGIWVEGGVCPENLFNAKDKRSDEQDSKSAVSNPPKMLGTASIVVELQRDAGRCTEGKNLIVAEWGERRIVRVEGETGARTPLVTKVPDAADEEMRRVFRPNHLMYTPFGDLLFSDSHESGSGEEMKQVASIFRLREAVHVPPIPVDKSREAHGWDHTSDDGKGAGSIDMLFHTGGRIDGMALGGSDHAALFVSVVSENASGWIRTVYKLSLAADDEEDDDDAKQTSDENAAATHQKVYSISSNECQDSNSEASVDFGSKIAIDESGTIYLSACPSTLVLLSSNNEQVIGNLDLNQMAQFVGISSVNFGEDGYIYLTSPHSLMRIKSRLKGRSIPTDMVVPPSLKTTRRDKRDKQ